MLSRCGDDSPHPVEDDMGIHAKKVEIVPVPLDSNTAERLRRFAQACGLDPLVAARRLLCDLLADDEFYNAAAREGPSTH